MRRTHSVLVGLTIVGLAGLVAIPPGQAQNPADQFNQPWLQKPGTQPAVPKGAPLPSYLPKGIGAPAAPGQPEGPDPCADLFVTQQAGPWMISIISYSTKVDNGPDSANVTLPAMAREMCLYLRDQYKLPAYVFVHGAEEKRKEEERVRKLIEDRKEALRKANLSTDQPIYVSRMRVDLQYAVLIGGYKDMDAAKKELDRIRKLTPPDARRVKLPAMYIVNKDGSGSYAATNPFTSAFVCRNPSAGAPSDRPPEAAKMDLALLKRLNEDESYSLLDNKKTLTLVVKQFPLATIVEQKKGATAGLLSNLGLLGKERADTAGASAHNLAELLRKGKWDAYVLHTKFYSIVTVGGYDSTEDPRLARDQQELARINQKLDPRIQMLPKALPMAVPR